MVRIMFLGVIVAEFSFEHDIEWLNGLFFQCSYVHEYFQEVNFFLDKIALRFNFENKKEKMMYGIIFGTSLKICTVLNN